MKQIDVDIAYLNEFIDWGSHGPAAVARCLHTAYVSEIEQGNPDSAAYFQLRLFSEMMQVLESAGALLRAYSMWDHPGGIIEQLWTYRPGAVADFIAALESADDVLDMLRFPAAETLAERHPDAEREILSGWTDEHINTLVLKMLGPLKDELERGAFNKIKHATIAVRSPNVFGDPSPPKAEGDPVYQTSVNGDLTRKLNAPLFCAEAIVFEGM